jgi:hypothetical protein
MKRLFRLLLPGLLVGSALLLWFFWDPNSPGQETIVATGPQGEVDPYRDPDVARALADTAPINHLSDAAGSVSRAVYRGSLGLSGRIRGWNDFPVSGARVQLRYSRRGRAADPLESDRLLQERVLNPVLSDQSDLAARAEADDQGVFFVPMEGLPAGVYQVVASAGGLAPERKLWTWAGEPGEINFRLAAGETIEGKVLNEVAQQVEGASVLALTQGGEGRGNWSGERQLVSQVESADDGTFRLDVYPGSFQLQARAPGYAPSRSRAVRSGSSGIELILEPGRKVTGRVKNPFGQPVVGARISVWPNMVVKNWKGAVVGQSTLGDAYARCTSDAGGNFRVDDLPPGRFVLLTEKSGYEPRLMYLDFAAPDEVVQAEVQLEQGRVLRGRVLDPDQQPVVGALVTAARSRASAVQTEVATQDDFPRWSARKLGYLPIPLPRATAAVETDSSGFFQLDTLEPARYDLSVLADGLLPARLEGLNPELATQALAIVLEAGSTLEGRIISSSTGHGVGEALLIVGRLGHRRFTRTDSSGQYKIEGLLEGEIDEVRVEAQGYGLLTVNDVEVAGVSTRLDLQLVPAIKVSGFVTNASGRAVHGAWVHVQPAMGVPELEIAEDGRRRIHLQHKLSVRGQTDANGRFNLENVNPASSLEITVRHPVYGVLRGESLPVAEGGQIAGLHLAFPYSRQQ